MIADIKGTTLSALRPHLFNSPPDIMDDEEMAILSIYYAEKVRREDIEREKEAKQ
jgi:hypothetical protein